MLDNKGSRGNDSFVELINFLITVYKITVNGGMAKFPSFFYEAVVSATRNIDPLFCAKSVVYFRHNIGVNSAIIHIAAELSSRVISNSWGKNFYDTLVKVPMDMVCIIKILKRRNIAVPNCVKKGFSKAFERFNEDDLSYCQNPNGEVNLIDVVNIVHPKHSDIIKKLIEGKIEIREIEVKEIDSKSVMEIEKLMKKNPKKIINDIEAVTFN